MMLRERILTSRGRRGGVVVAALALAMSTGACDVLSTDVENPNVVVQEDVELPAAAGALVAGTLLYMTDAMGQLAAAHGTVSDELTWRGSFDVVGAFDRGELQHHDNLYSTDGYEALTVGRWQADETVRILEEHDANGVLTDPDLLVQAYWLAGVAYLMAAENFEEFAISDRQEPGPVVDRGTLFDTSISHFGDAVDAATASSDLETAAMAYQARAYWARAMYQKLQGPYPIAAPLIDDANANTLANQVLGRVAADWQHVFEYTASTEQSRIAFEVNSRREVVIEDEIIMQDASLRQSCYPDNSACTQDGIRLMDPIDNIQDPAIRREAWGFFAGFIYADNVGVSARELNLMLAEAALSNSDDATYTTHINNVRGLESSLTAYDAVTHAAIDQQDLLIHMRRVNLILQLQRRLPDMYRFDIQGPVWASGQLALTAPGTVFPIGDLECGSNPLVGAC